MPPLENNMSFTLENIPLILYRLQTNQDRTLSNARTLETLLQWDASYRYNPTQIMPLLASEYEWFQLQSTHAQLHSDHQQSFQQFPYNDPLNTESNQFISQQQNSVPHQPLDTFAQNLILSHLERMQKAHTPMHARSLSDLRKKVARTLEYPFSLHGCLLDSKTMEFSASSPKKSTVSAAPGPTDTLPFIENNLFDTKLETLFQNKPRGVTTVWFAEWFRTIEGTKHPSTHWFNVEKLLRVLHFLVAFAIKNGYSQLAQSLKNESTKSLLETVISPIESAQSLLWRMHTSSVS